MLLPDRRREKLFSPIRPSPTLPSTRTLHRFWTNHANKLCTAAGPRSQKPTTTMTAVLLCAERLRLKHCQGQAAIPATTSYRMDLRPQSHGEISQNKLPGQASPHRQQLPTST